MAPVDGNFIRQRAAATGENGGSDGPITKSKDNSEEHQHNPTLQFIFIFTTPGKAKDTENQQAISATRSGKVPDKKDPLPHNQAAVPVAKRKPDEDTALQPKSKKETGILVRIHKYNGPD